MARPRQGKGNGNGKGNGEDRTLNTQRSRLKELYRSFGERESLY
jgi:hypothetical protein